MTNSSRQAYGEALVELGKTNEHVVVLEADLGKSTMTTLFAAAYPERYFQMGIAEQNMLGVAAGLAREGMIPFTHTFSAFASMRACEQLRTDIFYNQLNVKVIGTHGGLSTGPAGPTHFSLEDMGIVRAMPQSRLVVPADDDAATSLTKEILADSLPIYMRLDRNQLPRIYSGNECFEIGKSKLLIHGEDIAVIAVGAMVHVALEAAKYLRAENIHASVVDMYSIVVP